MEEISVSGKVRVRPYLYWGGANIESQLSREKGGGERDRRKQIRGLKTGGKNTLMEGQN